MSTIVDKLNEIADIKRLMRNEIIEKGVPVDENEPLYKYADDILNIPVEGEVKVEPLYITENGQYDAASGIAYNPVSVQVEANVDVKSITENGTYKAESEQLEGYSEVTVNVPEPTPVKPATDTLSITSSSLPQQIEPVSFDATSSSLDGYSKVTIDISGKLTQKQMTIDTDREAEQIIYDPTTENYYGCSKLTIIVKEKEGPFTVEFWNEGSILQTVNNVPKNGSAEYTGDVPTKQGYEFKGWNPQPVRVTTNIKCYAEFESKEDMNGNRQGSGGGSETEYQGTWKDIAATGGADLPIGTTIDIYYGPFSAEFGINLRGGQITMKKVYSGEAGTSSTWLSESGLPIPANSFGYSLDTGGWAKDWTNSKIYNVLNGAFLSALGAMSGEDFKESAAVVQAIKPVPKPAIGVSQYSDPENPDTWYIMKEGSSTPSIWIPSEQECGSTSYEESGVSYGQISTSYMVTRSASNPERILIPQHSPDYDDWDKYWSGKVVGSRFMLSGARATCWGEYDESYASAYEANMGRTWSWKWKPEPVTSTIRIGFCT